MNLPGNFGQGAEPEWLAAREKFFAVLDKHDKPYAGFAFAHAPFGTLDTIRDAAKRMSYMTVSADVVHLMGLAKDLAEARTVASDHVKTDESNGNGVKKTESN